MTELEFKSLATGYNRIPLIAEAFADLETPLTLYLKLAQTQNAGKNTFLLESVVGGERFGRYSFIGLPATTVLRAPWQPHRDRQERRRDRDARRQSARLHRAYQRASRSRCAPACRASAAAWPATSATTRCATSRKSCRQRAEDDLGLPDIQLLVTEELAVIDNLSGKLYLIVYADRRSPSPSARRASA
jgi:anthranilate synthase component 1